MRPLVVLLAGLVVLFEAIDSTARINNADEKDPLLQPMKHMRMLSLGAGGFLVLYAVYHYVMSIRG